VGFAFAEKLRRTRHRVVDVDGLNIFYREAGADTSPALLLLHGFPTSSHMFRDLIPALADDYHVVAPVTCRRGAALNSALSTKNSVTLGRYSEMLESRRRSARGA